MLSGYHHEYYEYLFQFYAKIWRLNCDRSKSLCGGKRKPVWVRVVGGCVSVCTVYRGKEVTELLLSLPEPESLPSALSAPGNPLSPGSGSGASRRKLNANTNIRLFTVIILSDPCCQVSCSGNGAITHREMCECCQYWGQADVKVKIRCIDRSQDWCEGLGRCDRDTVIPTLACSAAHCTLRLRPLMAWSMGPSNNTICGTSQPFYVALVHLHKST